MALILAMQEGRSFYVGDTKIEVLTLSGQRAKVAVHGAMIAEYHLSLNNSTEVLPGVRLSLGLGSTVGTAKIAVEAPRSVRVLRDNLYAEDRKCG